MIDFATLQGLAIPEGEVAQIADAAGNVLWSASRRVVLRVEKINSYTYSLPTYTSHGQSEFVAFDIYLKSGGTVTVTYGDLTKTVADDGTQANPMATVYFGTFMGVSDEVPTPASGILTIEGDYVAFRCAYYQQSRYLKVVCGCVSEIIDIGNIEYIPDNAFSGPVALGGAQLKIAYVDIPDSVTSIGNNAFHNCYGIKQVTIPESVMSIGNNAFIIITSGYERVVTMLSAIPPTLGEKVFDGLGQNHIVVPVGSGAAYKAAEGWSVYADYITEG